MAKNNLTAEWDEATPIKTDALASEWDQATPIGDESKKPPAESEPWYKKMFGAKEPTNVGQPYPSVSASDVTENPDPFGGTAIQPSQEILQKDPVTLSDSSVGGIQKLKGTPVAPGMPTGIPPEGQHGLETLINPIIRAPIQAAGTAALLAGGIESGHAQDTLFKFYDDTRKMTAKLSPDAKAPFVDKFIDGVIGIVPYLVSGGPGAVSMLANSASRGAEAVNQGIDPNTATVMAVKDLIITAAMFKAPFGGKSIVGGATKGAGINMGLDIADKALEKGILTEGDYKELADKIKIVDPSSLGAAAGMGAIFGVQSSMGKVVLPAWYYTLSNRERSLVALTVADLRKQGFTDAELAKKSPEYYRQLMAERNNGEPPPEMGAAEKAARSKLVPPQAPATEQGAKGPESPTMPPGADEGLNLAPGEDVVKTTQSPVNRRLPENQARRDAVGVIQGNGGQFEGAFQGKDGEVITFTDPLNRIQRIRTADVTPERIQEIMSQREGQLMTENGLNIEVDPKTGKKYYYAETKAPSFGPEKVPPVPATTPEIPTPGPSGTERAAPAPLEPREEKPFHEIGDRGEGMKIALSTKEKAGLIEHEGEAVSKQESKDILRKTEPPSKKQKEGLIAQIDEHIKNAPDTSVEIKKLNEERQRDLKSDRNTAFVEQNLSNIKRDMVDIEVPGDGTFSVFNDKDALLKFKSLVERQFPTTPLKEGKPYPTPWGKVKASKLSPTDRLTRKFEADKAAVLKGRDVTPEQKSIIEQGGGIPYAYDREKNQVYFHEPSGSTLQLPADQLTPEAVRAKVEGYGKTGVVDKLTDIYKRSKLSGEGGGVGEKPISPAFYSKLQKTIDLSMPNRATADVVRSIIKDVKADEIKWSGIDDYLAEHKGMVDKKDLLNFLRENQVELKEVVKGDKPEEYKTLPFLLSDNTVNRRTWISNIGNDDVAIKEFPTGKFQVSIGVHTMRDFPSFDQADDFVQAQYRKTGRGTGTKFSNYQLPGGENYREMLLTLPVKEKSPFSKPRPEPLTALPPEYGPIHDSSRPDGTQWAMTHDSEVSARPLWNRHPTPEAAKTEGLKMLNLARMETWEKEKRDYQNDTTGDYKSSHWDEPNVLAHVRMNDRVDAAGKKVLFIEEVQSDWHQEGKRKGYGDRINPREFLEQRGHDVSKLSANQVLNEAHALGWNEGSIPPAPFSKSWPLLAMKRMIRYAAENGYDKIAWTTGEQQAARYDLSKQIQHIEYRPTTSGFDVTVKDINGQTVDSIPTVIPGNRVADFFGKEIEQKMKSAQGAKDDYGYFKLSGLDLKVGGEGMKGFYDQILPAEVNKYVKKWGARVGETKIPVASGKELKTGWQLATRGSGDDGENAESLAGFFTRETAQQYVDVHGLQNIKIVDNGDGFDIYEKVKQAASVPSIDITPSMRSEVMHKGQELYSFPGVPTKLTKELAEAYKRPPEWTESKKIIGQYTGALQEIDFKLSKLAKEINAALPKERQEAVTNYMQAGGDAALLSERAKSSDLKYRKGYEDAANLTPEEKQWADSFRKRLDDVWQQAHEAGIMEDYVENYVRGEWERPEQAGKKLIAMVNSGIFRTKPREALHKVFQDYFEGEQAGFKPKNKRIGYQLIAAERSIRSAIEARKALRNMMASTEADGRPTVAVGGGGSYSPETTSAEKKAYYVKPNVKGKEVADYKFLDHPSLRKWKWVDMDSEGKPILLEGNMWIHPEAFGRINALLGKSKIKTYTVPEKVPIIGGTQPGRVALQAGAFIKGTILIGPFHQFHVGEHALFHKVNPFSVPAIDFDTRPILREGVEHGLMLYNHNAMLEFGEGLASGGLFHRIPKVGDQLKRYQEWLFQDYIPRLKAAMYEHAVTRAEKYYAKDLASGKLTRDQLLDNAAKQANAAFGEQNYRYIGRNPTLQDALRIGLLAPDFLEARLKFAGQAVRPYGKEQAMALIRGAIIMATTAQILNMLIGDDHKPRWDRPFSLIIGGREYSPRSVVADIGHLITDPRSFWYHRLNPLWGRPIVELVSGKDRFGRKVNAVETARDVLKSWTPIPAQGLVTKKDMGKTAVEAVINSLLQSIGVSNYPYKSNAEKLMSEMQSEKGTFTSAHPELSQAKREIKQGIRGGDIKPSVSDISKAAKEKGFDLSPRQRMEVLRGAKKTDFAERFNRLSADEASTVWDKATDAEKAQVARLFQGKIMRSTTMSMKDKQQLFVKLRKYREGLKKE